MTEGAVSRKELTATVAMLITAAGALGGAAALGWAQVTYQVPKRGIVEVRVDGSEMLPALGPLAVLALAAVAAVLATGGWARRLLGGLLLVAAVPPALGVLRTADEGWLTGAAVSAAGLPNGSAVEMVMVLPAGPGSAAGGAVLLVAAGAALVVRGQHMPGLGRRYQAPAAGSSGHPDTALWERMDAGEDPTTFGDPR